MQTKVAIRDIGLEQAHAEANRMTNQTRFDNAQSTVFTGDHPEFGRVYIVIPLAGDAMILPIVIQNFDV